MNKNPDKKQGQPEQKQAPVTTDKQQIKSIKLSDADLDKVRGGGAQPHMNTLTPGTIYGAVQPTYKSII